MGTYLRLAAWFAAASCSIAFAQIPRSDTYLLPPNPTSADSLVLLLGSTTCGGQFVGNSYNVKMVQNAITVALGAQTMGAGPGPCPRMPPEYISLGRLPAGAYYLTVNYFAPGGTTPLPVFANYAFTVADGRALKIAPYVRLDYSGHWWDPADSGWGLFIWHDVRDNVLAAWFTYGTDGKPMWYVFQPAWQTSTTTKIADVVKVERLPGLLSPPPTQGTIGRVGTASLDFNRHISANLPPPYYLNDDEVAFTYAVEGGAAQTRKLKRFNMGEVAAKYIYGGDTVMLPANPTSADRIKISLSNRTCGGAIPYKDNPYFVSSAQNNILVTLGARQAINPTPLCPPLPREDIDLGVLPAGNYTLSIAVAAEDVRYGEASFVQWPFAVSDARKNKNGYFVRLDYSGHWWDPNDPGWGLFIWQDARSQYDDILAAWFTYSADGKPIWYTFQPTWRSSTATLHSNLYQTSRGSGSVIPPATPTTLSAIGNASLDFTNFNGTSTTTTIDEGTLTYSIGGGQVLTRNIRRFKP